MKKYESWWNRKIVDHTYTTIDKFRKTLDRNKSRYEYLKLVEEISPKTILDAGCGLGLDYKMYQEKYPHIKYYGLDITRGFIVENKKNYPEVDFIVAKIQDIPLKSSSIDLVTCRAVLEHIPKPEPAISEMTRVSKKYVAIIWFIIPDIEEDDIRITQSGFYRNRYSESRIIENLINNGLKLCYITEIKGPSVMKKHELWVLEKL